MRNRIIAIVLIVFCLSGCFPSGNAAMVNFYYPRAEYGYNTEDGVIAAEVRNNGGISSAAPLLTLYLKGPLDEKLRNPFPAGLSVISVYTLEDTVYVTLTDALATLSGAPLILTCCCIGRTAMELTGANSAQIQCYNLLLDGKKFITVNDQTVFYSDTFHQAETGVS